MELAHSAITTIYEHDINRYLTMEEACMRAQYNKNRSIVSSILQAFRRENR